MNKMVKISAETYVKNCVYTIKVNLKVDNEYSLRIRMIDIQKGLDVENIIRFGEKNNSW